MSELKDKKHSQLVIGGVFIGRPDGTSPRVALLALAFYKQPPIRGSRRASPVTRCRGMIVDHTLTQSVVIIAGVQTPVFPLQCLSHFPFFMGIKIWLVKFISVAKSILNVFRCI